MMTSPAEILKRPYARVVVPEEDGSFRAEILEFTGCNAAGDTAAGALASLEEVAASWLEGAMAKGLPIPPPVEAEQFSGKLVLRLPRSLHRRAAHAAKRDGVSLNQFIVGCVAEQVGIRSAVTSVFSNTAVNILTGPLQPLPHGIQSRYQMPIIVTRETLNFTTGGALVPITGVTYARG
jgi:predicted HicB family RNase H-like nuclease